MGDVLCTVESRQRAKSRLEAKQNWVEGEVETTAPSILCSPLAGSSSAGGKTVQVVKENRTSSGKPGASFKVLPVEASFSPSFPSFPD